MSDVDAYLRKLSTLAISQICQEAGWDGIRQSSLDTLIQITSKYVQEIGVTATTFSGLAGRSETNFFDVRNALEELGTNVSSVMQYHSMADELPFGKSLPRFPLCKEVKMCVYEGPGDDAEDGQAANESHASQPHIPPFLPPFPPKRTYIATPMPVEKETDRSVLLQRKLVETDHVAKSLTGLHRDTQGFSTEQPVANYHRRSSAAQPVANRSEHWGRTPQQEVGSGGQRRLAGTGTAGSNGRKKGSKKRARDNDEDDEDEDEDEDEARANPFLQPTKKRTPGP